MLPIHHWEPEQIERFWDYESQFPRHYWARNNGAKLIKLYSKEIKKSKQILDLGCGDGGLLDNLIPYLDRNSNGKVYGFDTSKDSISLVNKSNKNKKCFGGAFFDIEELEAVVGKNAIDFIFCGEVIEHVYDDALSDILNTARRLLSKSGVLLITTPNNECLEDNYVCNPLDGSLFHRWQHVRSWNKTSLTQTLKDHKLKVINTLETSDLWSCSFPINIYRRLKYRKKLNLFVLAQNI